MKTKFRFFGLVVATSVAFGSLAGCGEKATESVDSAVHDAGEAASAAAASTTEAAKEAAANAGDALNKLGEDAKAFMSPLKDEFAALKGMVDEPEKLKQSADDLIQKIETNLSKLKLPESVTNTLNAAKEKLIELRDYISDEAEKAQIEEKVQAVTDTVKDGLGMKKD
ncbi:hypothetical protein NHH03_00100 [Stieleria sp. TO1_6]|uniref:hypothetical protein n=1 Tax=Stieleria tagensis TaxID=2956795 RepID=UPI00209AB917|nr:hypothetical protein [Stieleria tagensis]MCO8120120.1 hypothetical protein [Stieleria tagensis]